MSGLTQSAGYAGQPLDRGRGATPLSRREPRKDEIVPGWAIERFRNRIRPVETGANKSEQLFPKLGTFGRADIAIAVPDVPVDTKLISALHQMSKNRTYRVYAGTGAVRSRSAAPASRDRLFLCAVSLERGNSTRRLWGGFATTTIECKARRNGDTDASADGSVFGGSK
jgi:hypothetical protein